MRELSIPRQEYEQRQEDLIEQANADGYDGVVLFDSMSIEYISGLFHLPTERPLVLGVTADETHVVVPKLEQDHVERHDFTIDKTYSYFDYPQGEPLQLVAEMCAELGINDQTIAVDSDGSPPRNGYQGPSLSELISGTVGCEEYVTDMREVKSENEVELIQEASMWANLGHQILQDKIATGKRPITLCSEVEAEASARMLDTLGDTYEMRTGDSPISCSFTTGEVTYRPHSVNMANRINKGDNIVTIVKASVGGYQTELERTMFVGEPDDKQRKFFKIMREAQQTAIDTLADGVPYARVEEAVLNVYEDHNVMEYNHHHIGHNIGMDFHERPFLDVGYDGTLRAGELYTVEPALFVPDVGGFRHSDTVVVHNDGAERLTHYSRDLEDLIIQV
ncbi:M24 family metallopeptidase [Halopenitus persicus]|uniref:M24 family metallopeptidase n=1 Tax=Halopenitus persicus TaxID=1048396 RepID=UPI000B843493|nr:Xaa-Pro peptidase family protein [Halopenitus persicus]